MKKIRTLLSIFLFLSAVLPACGIATPQPTATATAVPSDTQAPALTSTPVPTNTPTSIPPMTQTAQALALAQTVFAVNATATHLSELDMKTATAAAIRARATDMASAKEISYDELTANTYKHVNQWVKIRIDIYQIVSDKELKGNFTTTYVPVFVKMRDPFTDLHRGDTITVYGIVEGNKSDQNAYGTNVTMPVISYGFYIKR